MTAWKIQGTFWENPSFHSRVNENYLLVNIVYMLMLWNETKGGCIICLVTLQKDQYWLLLGLQPGYWSQAQSWYTSLFFQQWNAKLDFNKDSCCCNQGKSCESLPSSGKLYCFWKWWGENGCFWRNVKEKICNIYPETYCRYCTDMSLLDYFIGYHFFDT